MSLHPSPNPTFFLNRVQGRDGNYTGERPGVDILLQSESLDVRKNVETIHY